MKVIGKTDNNFIIEISPTELKDVIAWDEVGNGALDLGKLNIGHNEVAAQDYKTIIALKDIKAKINDAKAKANQALIELNSIDLSSIPEKAAV
jgi:hypothetical protein